MTPIKSTREAQRLAELDYLDAMRLEADQVLQEIVDEVRLTFETQLCMVNLILSEVQYFRAWSGKLPEDLAQARRDPRERSMCQYVVGTEKPLIVPDFVATEEFKDQYFCVNYGIRFYAGTPLVTSNGRVIGTLCLLDTRPRGGFGEEQMRILGAFARAVVGRLELLGALGRERAIREKEAQHAQEMASIFESITDAFFALDREWRFTYLNSEAERLLNRGREDLLGKNLWEEFPEAVYSTFHREYHRAVKEGVRVEFEESYPPLGTWFAVRAYPSESGVSVYFQDVNQRKQTEEALRYSEKRFRSLVQYASDIVTVLDADGTVRYQSPSIERILGYGQEELVGKNVFDYVHPEDRERVWDAFADALQNQDVSPLVEFRFRHVDDSWRYLEAIGNNLLGDPSVGGMVVNSRDISERKQAERERARLLIREQAARAEAETTQQHLKVILDNLAEGVLVADPRGHIVFSNPAALALLGVRSEGLLEKLPNLWEDFHLPMAVAQCARNKEGIEARVRSGESYLWVKLECMGDDERGEVLVVMRDLSEGYRLEANQQRFLANAAHQLRTPIMAVMGAAELLATGEDANPATRSRLLNYIFSEGRRLQRLADTLLRLSRVGWDMREPELEVVDLVEAGRQAIGLMEPLAESGGLRLIIEYERASNVRADPEWLQEVLLVLLSNAIKHSSRGGDIRIRVEDRSITVKDEGVGISPVDLTHVFERFYRGEGSSEGFGLGLAICKELTERMEGSISIKSQEGIGTVVRVELPETKSNT